MDFLASLDLTESMFPFLRIVRDFSGLHISMPATSSKPCPLAPRVFTKIMIALITSLCFQGIHVDHLLIRSPSLLQRVRDIRLVCLFLLCHSFLINCPKSPDPPSAFQPLGAIIASANSQVHLSPDHHVDKFRVSVFLARTSQISCSLPRPCFHSWPLQWLLLPNQDSIAQHDISNPASIRSLGFPLLVV